MNYNPLHLKNIKHIDTTITTTPNISNLENIYLINKDNNTYAFCYTNGRCSIVTAKISFEKTKARYFDNVLEAYKHYAELIGRTVIFDYNYIITIDDVYLGEDRNNDKIYIITNGKVRILSFRSECIKYIKTK